MIVKLLTEHHFGSLSFKGGYRGSPESTLVKMLEISYQGSTDIEHFDSLPPSYQSCHFLLCV